MQTYTANNYCWLHVKRKKEQTEEKYLVSLNQTGSEQFLMSHMKATGA